MKATNETTVTTFKDETFEISTSKKEERRRNNILLVAFGCFF